MPNVPDFPRVYYAALSLGAVVVPVHALLVGREIAYVLRDSGAKLLVAAAPLLAQGAPAAAEAGVPLLAVMGGEGVDRLDLLAADAEPIGSYVAARARGRGGHPVHVGHHRLAQGRRADPAEHDDERDRDRDVGDRH